MDNDAMKIILIESSSSYFIQLFAPSVFKKISRLLKTFMASDNSLWLKIKAFDNILDKMNKYEIIKLRRLEASAARLYGDIKYRIDMEREREIKRERNSGTEYGKFIIYPCTQYIIIHLNDKKIGGMSEMSRMTARGGLSRGTGYGIFMNYPCTQHIIHHLNLNKKK